jgi:chromosome segregation ATPase
LHLSRYFIWLDPPFPLGFDCDQEIKERSSRKSLFIHHESGVWAALPRQRALIDDVNKRLFEKSTEADELHVVHATLKEEAVQARDTAAKAQEDATKAREEAAKAREDLAPLLARVKELEEDVAHVSGQRDVLNMQIGVDGR